MSTAISPAFAQDVSAASDRDLVVTAITGSEGGFEELVRRYQRPIAAYVYRMVGDYDAALDLTQEVFIKVYASLSRYRPEFKFSTWIYKIAHNAADRKSTRLNSSHPSISYAVFCLKKK